MIRASRPIPQATMKIRSARGRVVRAGSPAGRPPAGQTEVEPTRPAGPDGVEGRPDAADAEAPGQDVAGPGRDDRQRRSAVSHGGGRLADAAVPADRDDQGMRRRRRRGSSRIAASEPASITGSRPVRLRTAADGRRHDPVAPDRVDHPRCSRVDEDERVAGGDRGGGHRPMLPRFRDGRWRR